MSKIKFTVDHSVEHYEYDGEPVTKEEYEQLIQADKREAKRIRDYYMNPRAWWKTSG